MKYPKTDVRYWREVIYRQSKAGPDGQRTPYGDWTVRIAYGGGRETFPLGTLNKELAAAKAREIFLFARANGMKAAVGAFKKNVERPGLVTVGDLIEEAGKHLDVRPKTFAGYARALRKIVAELEKIEDPEGKKYDYQAGGRDQWLARIDSVKLSKLSPERISAWRTAFVARHRGDKAAEHSARISAASFIRESRALFSEEVTKHLDLSSLSGRLPFDGIKTGKRLSMRYRSSIDDIEALIADACRELNTPEHRESFKAFCLAALVGLRRSEIDRLEWRAFDFNRGILRLEVTKYFAGKSESSLGDVPIDPELVALFRGFKAQSTGGSFVVEAEGLPNLKAGYSHYRARGAFEFLIKWLRERGISGNSPVHTLRKEFGSAMVRKHGIFAASQALRHSDISVTREHYADDEKARVSVGLGHLLSKPANIISITQDDKNNTQQQIVT